MNFMEDVWDTTLSPRYLASNTERHCLAARDEAGRQIAACDDGQARAAQPGETPERPAITEHAPRALQERLHGSGIFEQSYH